MISALKRGFTIAIIACILPLSVSADKDDSDKVKASKLLDHLHTFAATGNWDAYFPLFAKGAVFVGTDASENWSLGEFEAFARRYKGWTYVMTQRSIRFSKDKKVAWFHELLTNTSYGTTRGTGTLLKSDQGWKIAQYSLTIPVPNAIAKKVTQDIAAYKNQKETKKPK